MGRGWAGDWVVCVGNEMGCVQQIEAGSPARRQRASAQRPLSPSAQSLPREDDPGDAPSPHPSSSPPLRGKNVYEKACPADGAGPAPGGGGIGDRRRGWEPELAVKI